MSEEDREKVFLEKAKAVLDESEEDLDAHILSRLRQARSRALQGEEKERPGLRTWFPFPVAASMVAALLAIFVAVIYLTRPPGLEPHKSIGDLEILASNDHLELYANLDFYDWLSKEKQHGG